MHARRECAIEYGFCRAPLGHPERTGPRFPGLHPGDPSHGIPVPQRGHDKILSRPFAPETPTSQCNSAGEAAKLMVRNLAARQVS
jgi:hypothetical protein